MDTLHALEVIVNLVLQSLGGWLKSPMLLFSFFGTEEFFMLAMPVFFWCVDSTLGLRLGLMLLLSNSVNQCLKVSFATVRPFWFDPAVQALSQETGFGLPSNHAQTAASLWGLAVIKIQRRWVSIVGVALIFLIGLSRLYLGVHFLSDVLVGWIIGGLLIWLFLRSETAVANWLKPQTVPQKFCVAGVSGLLLFLAMALPMVIREGWQAPAEWIRVSERTGAVLPDPIQLGTVFTLTGTWFGLAGGLIWFYQRRGGLFDARGTAVQKLLRYLLGLFGIALIWFGLGQVLPRASDALSLILRLLRYTLVGLWISALAPFLFIRLKWAK